MMLTLKKFWQEAIVLGGLWRNVTRLELFKFAFGFVFGACAMFALRAYTNSGPSVINGLTPDKMEVTVHGADVDIHIAHNELRRACLDAYVLRKLVRYWNNDPKRGPSDTVDIMEHDIAWNEIGRQDLTAHMHLFGPLDRPDGWHLIYERHDHCGWLDDLFPERPFVGGPIPVAVR